MVVDRESTLFLLGDFRDLVVEIPLTQGMLQRVAEETPVEIEARDSKVETVMAAVSRISPFLEEASFSTTAEIDVPGHGSGLRPGMFVTVRVLYGASRRATLVPASAVWEEPTSGDRLVFVVEESDGLAEPETAPGDVPDRARRVSLRPVEILAEGRGQVGLEGVAPGEWVITLGQHLVHRMAQAVPDQQPTARVRPTSWERVIGLQQLQREDLLERFLAKQRQLARALGADLPASPEEAERALDGAPPGGLGDGG
jgi:multidrug efflux pump subunit AcrA (membrane-fusion protein)